jgi:hypothetical protein
MLAPIAAGRVTTRRGPAGPRADADGGRDGSSTAVTPGLRRGRLDGDELVAKGAVRDQERKEMLMLRWRAPPQSSLVEMQFRPREHSRASFEDLFRKAGMRQTFGGPTEEWALRSR